MIRLLVLWLLSERAMYGYEIKKSLSDPGFAFWFPVEDASIYSALRTLAKHGYAVEAAVEQPGARPRRTRYAITAEGRRLYHRLLAEALATPVLSVGLVDVALAAGGDLDPTEIGVALSARAKALAELREDIEGARRAAPHPAIVDRNLGIVEAELRWLERLDHASIG
jgi:DNA-binding PadR family transcriptional regulator